MLLVSDCKDVIKKHYSIYCNIKFTETVTESRLEISSRKSTPQSRILAGEGCTLKIVLYIKLFTSIYTVITNIK